MDPTDSCILFGMLTRVLVLTISLAVAATAADKKVVRPASSTPAGPYSPGIIAGGTLYVAGQVGRDKDNKYPASFEDEVAQTLENIGVILKEAGYTQRITFLEFSENVNAAGHRPRFFRIAPFTDRRQHGAG